MKPPPSTEDVLQATADAYGVEVSYILKDTRKEEVVRLRHTAQYLCRRFVWASLERIGEKTGGKDHATITHAYKKMSWWYGRYNDPTFYINKIINLLDERGFDVSRDVVRILDEGLYTTENVFYKNETA